MATITNWFKTILSWFKRAPKPIGDPEPKVVHGSIMSVTIDGEATYFNNSINKATDAMKDLGDKFRESKDIGLIESDDHLKLIQGGKVDKGTLKTL